MAVTIADIEANSITMNSKPFSGIFGVEQSCDGL